MEERWWVEIEGSCRSGGSSKFDKGRKLGLLSNVFFLEILGFSYILLCQHAGFSESYTTKPSP